MSRGYIAKALRERVSEQPRHRCGYCLTAEAVVGTPMELDHIIPEILGGPTEEANLWLACSLCNGHKGDRIAAPDPQTDETVRLFDLRRQRLGGSFPLDGGRRPCDRIDADRPRDGGGAGHEPPVSCPRPPCLGPRRLESARGLTAES